MNANVRRVLGTMGCAVVLAAAIGTSIRLDNAATESTPVTVVEQTDIAGGILYHMSDQTVRVCSDWAPNGIECTGNPSIDLVNVGS